MTSELSFTPRPGLHRRPAGFLALAYPVMLIGLALTVDFRGSSEGSGLATAFLGAILLLVAAPTAWIFAIDFIEASRLTVHAVGALTSLPLWYLLGSRLALGSDLWRQWLRRYASICGSWTVLTLVLMVVLDQIG